MSLTAKNLHETTPAGSCNLLDADLRKAQWSIVCRLGPRESPPGVEGGWLGQRPRAPCRGSLNRQCTLVVPITALSATAESAIFKMHSEMDNHGNLISI